MYSLSQEYRNPYDFGGTENWRIFFGLSHGRQVFSTALFEAVWLCFISVLYELKCTQSGLYFGLVSMTELNYVGKFEQIQVHRPQRRIAISNKIPDLKLYLAII